MTILFILVPLAILLSGIAVLAFAWSARSGQLDDLHTPALRVLHDEDPAPRPPTTRPAPQPSAANAGRARCDDESDSSA